MQPKELKISSIDLGIDLRNEYKPKKKTEQRSDDWFNKRAGSWTGSRIKELMACSSRGSKMSWSDDDKIYEFSKGIIKQIYQRAMERKTKRYILTHAGNAAKFGNLVEPFIKAIGEELIDAKIEEVGYKEFPNFPNAGASSDGVCHEHKSIAEIKACNTWQTHYDRTFDLMNEKSTDFWQTQAEMKAWGYEKGFYFVSEPPKDVNEYLYHEEAKQLLDETFDGDIKELELFKKFKKECAVSVQELKASPFHQRAMMERIKICEMVCTEWIEKGGDLEELFWQKVDELKNGSEFLNEVEVKEAKIIKSKKVKEEEPEEVNHRKSTLETPPNFNDIPF